MVGKKIEVETVKPNLLVYRIPSQRCELSEEEIKLTSGKSSAIVGSLLSTEELAEFSKYVSKDVVEAKTGEELWSLIGGAEIPLSQRAERIKEGRLIYPESLEEFGPAIMAYIDAFSLCGGDEEAYKELIKAVKSAEGGKVKAEISKEKYEKIPKAIVKEYATYGILDSGTFPIFEIKLRPITDQGIVEEMEKEIVEKAKKYQGPSINLGAYQLLEQAQALPSQIGEAKEILRVLRGIGDVLELKLGESDYWRRGLFSKDPL